MTRVLLQRNTHICSRNSASVLSRRVPTNDCWVASSVPPSPRFSQRVCMERPSRRCRCVRQTEEAGGRAAPQRRRVHAMSVRTTRPANRAGSLPVSWQRPAAGITPVPPGQKPCTAGPPAPGAPAGASRAAHSQLCRQELPRLPRGLGSSPGSSAATRLLRGAPRRAPWCS